MAPNTKMGLRKYVGFKRYPVSTPMIRVHRSNASKLRDYKPHGHSKIYNHACPVDAGTPTSKQ